MAQRYYYQTGRKAVKWMTDREITRAISVGGTLNQNRNKYVRVFSGPIGSFLTGRRASKNNLGQSTARPGQKSKTDIASCGGETGR